MLANSLLLGARRRLHPQADKIRAEFDANAALDDPNQVERALIRGENKLSQHIHPDPYIGASRYLCADQPV